MSCSSGFLLPLKSHLALYEPVKVAGGIELVVFLEFVSFCHSLVGYQGQPLMKWTTDHFSSSFEKASLELVGYCGCHLTSLSSAPEGAALMVTSGSFCGFFLLFLLLLVIFICFLIIKTQSTCQTQFPRVSLIWDSLADWSTVPTPNRVSFSSVCHVPCQSPRPGSPSPFFKAFLCLLTLIFRKWQLGRAVQRRTVQFLLLCLPFLQVLVSCNSYFSFLN